MKKHTIFITIVITLAIGIGMWRESHIRHNNKVSTTPKETQLLTGTALPESKALPPFEFIDQDNHAFNNAQLKDHWSFVFFGYTQCPEQCPRILGALNNVSQRVGPNPMVQYLFVSITPEIDTPEKLKTFFAQDQFKLTRFIGLTGENKNIVALANQLGIYIADETGINIEHIGHSGTILLVNPKGELSALFTTAENPHRIAHDFKDLMSVYARS
ncbi:SCO family protein [Candidatus Berkiella cookevillensis]|uniref:SCO family protein n=1 Tax=Candidatus Berkiella cookevillensis TaxID=437022 RepID=A0A0Q9YPB4_9GAMM|nr:SCO family protein [Candidatus Berkiella cookevillensis]MCS5707470.1 SCO family protein [Candidatus Berkiella cookevillensis]